eukprot:10645375-Alexandrium_andersonii.AAC.1
MSASLVGSEMCIRDRLAPARSPRSCAPGPPGARSRVGPPVPHWGGVAACAKDRPEPRSALFRATGARSWAL